MLGFLRRRRERSKGATPRFHPGNPPVTPSTPITEPIGEIVGDRYIPDPRELAAAEPLPDFLLGAEETLELVSEETYGWVLLNAGSWRPRRAPGVKGEVLEQPVRLPGRVWEYHAMVWTGDGRVYLMDGITYGLVYLADGSRTAQDLVGEVLSIYVEGLPESNPLRREVESGGKSELVNGVIAALYASLALLREKGILI